MIGDAIVAARLEQPAAQGRQHAVAAQHGYRGRIDCAGEAREIEAIMRFGHAVSLLDLEIGDIARGAIFGRLEGERLGRTAAIGDVELQSVAIGQPAVDGAIRRWHRLSERGACGQQGSDEGSPEHSGRYHVPGPLQ